MKKQFDIEEYSMISYQILIDISSVWYYRKIIKAKVMSDEGFDLEEIAIYFKVSPATAGKYILKFQQIMESTNAEVNYKFFVALTTIDKSYDCKDLDKIRKYVYQTKVYKEDWYFKIKRK